MRDDAEVSVQHTYQRTLAPGEVVYDEGDPGEHLYLIQAGEIELFRARDEERRVVARLGAGDFFGEQSVVLEVPRSATAVAVGGARVIVLDRESFEDLCLDRPEVAVRLIRELVSRRSESERRLTAVGADDLLRPLVRAILGHAEPQTGSGLQFRGQLRDLAGSAGLSMREAHGALHALLDQELVALAEDVLQVPDAEALCAALES